MAASPTEVCPVRVVARFRPPIAEEREEPSAAFVVENGVIESADHLHCFRLDAAFGQETSQEMVYEEVGRSVVQDVLSGYNGTILAYGPTGSGKTFCMFGPHGHKAPLAAGMVPRAVQQVLDFADQQEGVTLHCSFFEVYLEKVRDFLSKLPNAQVKESPGSDGLTYRKITTAGEALQILRLGLKLRVAANTRLNEHSSRSHAIFSLILRQEDSSGVRQRKLTLVDLAGSEKVWQSGSVGGRLEEAKKINSSLSALGHVIEALADRRPHVPFRDSRLTRLLEESLGGNCRTTLLVACSPSQLHSTETLSSLRFAARAKKIENMVGVTIRPALESSPNNTRRLERRIAQLRRELARLEHRRAGLATNQAAASGSRSHSADQRRRTPSPSPGARSERISSVVKSSKKEVPEALPLPASAASSYRSTATGTSSTASVAAVSLAGSASGTPLSRDPEAAERFPADSIDSPRVVGPPPATRASYSFIIEATPVECRPRAPKPLTQATFYAEAPEEEEVATTSAALERHAAALSQRCADLAKKLATERQRHSVASSAPLLATPIRNRESPDSLKETPIPEVRGRSTASCASRLASCITGDHRARPSNLPYGHQAWISGSSVVASPASVSPVRAMSPMSRSPGAKSGRVLSQYLFSVPDDGRPLQVSTSMSPLRRAHGAVAPGHPGRLPWSAGPSGHISPSVNHW